MKPKTKLYWRVLLIASNNDRFFISSEGFEALFRELDSMGVKGERAAHKALREGGKVFLGLAKGGVNRSNRKSDKHLIDALAVSTVKLDDGGNKYVSVGTYLGRGRYRNKVYWGHIVEGGHWIVNKGVVRGYVSARPFMQPAFDNGKDAATEAVSKIVFKAMGL